MFTVWPLRRILERKREKKREKERKREKKRVPSPESTGKTVVLIGIRVLYHKSIVPSRHFCSRECFPKDENIEATI